MLGQPMIVLLYFRDALKGTSGVWTHEDTQVWTLLLLLDYSRA